MKTLLKPAAALAIAVSLAACQQQSDEAAAPVEVSLDTPTQRLSYGVALNVGRNIARDGMELDIDAFTLGLRDALSEAEPRLTDDEIRAEMMAFQERFSAEREAARSVLAASNAEAATAFFAENAGRDGVQSTASGLQYEVLEAGDGAQPTADDQVRVHYRGTLLDGTVFDSSYDRGQPVTFGLGQVIPGWTEGLQLMSVGSKYKLFVPPELGYGAGGAGATIGPNAALVFEVELLGIPSQETEDDDSGES